MPALKKLLDAIASTVKKRGYLIGLDGRSLHVRSAHSALNLLLQSAGAILVKCATVIWHQKMHEAGYVFNVDYVQLAHVHDEIQGAARTSTIAEHAGKLMVQAFEDAGKFFNLKCPTTGEYKLGSSWAETH